MSIVIERLKKLLDNREDMDVRVLLLQSALGEITNSKDLGK